MWGSVSKNRKIYYLCGAFDNRHAALFLTAP
nr:MAG TPA: hypothetical protein [Caudoviricetes sp.]